MIQCLVSEVRSNKIAVITIAIILSERGPKRTSAWGAESKDPRLFFEQFLR